MDSEVNNSTKPKPCQKKSHSIKILCKIDFIYKTSIKWEDKEVTENQEVDGIQVIIF